MNLLDQLEDFPARASDIARVALGKKLVAAQPATGGGDTTFPEPDHLQQPVKLPGISERPSVAPAVSTRDVSLNLVGPGCDPDNDKRELITHGGEPLLPEPLLAEPHRGADQASALQDGVSLESITSVGQNTLGGGALNEIEASPASRLAQTLDNIVAFLRRYIVFPMPEQFDLVALWIAHTWVYDVFHWTPYLIVRSPEPECGKSTVLAAIKLLARAAWKVVVPTPAVIYRKIEAHRPTVIIDEYDTIYSEKIKSEANETLRGTLNAGFERGDVIPRCDGPKNELLEFSPYCPKALAGIGRLPETVESRAFIIPIVRLGHNEHVQEYDEETAPEEARPIAEALLLWAKSDGTRGDLKKSTPSRPLELKPRQRNISKPLLAIADMAGEEWGDRARHALLRICAKEKLISQAAQLLADIRKILFAGSMDKITTDTLLEYLVREENANSPWPVLWENDLKNGKTRGPAKKLAAMLVNFDIHPRTLRFGSDTKKGYVRADFAEAWDRYLEPAVAETAELDLEL